MVQRTKRLKAFLMQRRRELSIPGEWGDVPAVNADRLNAELTAFVEQNGLKHDFVPMLRKEMKLFIKEITEDKSCAVCGEKYYGESAASRRDGREICPVCGLREALEDAGLDAGEAVRRLRE